MCGGSLTEYAEEYITTRLAVIPEKVYKIEYYRKVYKCINCDKNGTKANIIAAENKTPVCIIKKGLPDASLVADIMQRKYQLGEPLYRQEQYWKLRGIYLNRTSLSKTEQGLCPWHGGYLCPEAERKTVSVPEQS